MQLETYTIIGTVPSLLVYLPLTTFISVNQLTRLQATTRRVCYSFLHHPVAIAPIEKLYETLCCISASSASNRHFKCPWDPAFRVFPDIWCVFLRCINECESGFSGTYVNA